MAQPRGTKTLGWFVGTEFLREQRKNGKTDGNGGGGGAQTTKRAAWGGQRSSEIDSKPSSEPSSSSTNCSSTIMTQNSNSPQRRQHSSYAGAARMNCIPEDYWFYDNEKDGYYYNQDGKTGWAKRQHDDPGPMRWERETPRRKHLNLRDSQGPVTPPQKQWIPQNIQNSQTQWEPRSPQYPQNPQNRQWISKSLQNPQNCQNSKNNLPATVRYDATSDGYYYDKETMNVRWMRLQPDQPPPLPPQGATPSPPESESTYGEALTEEQYALLMMIRHQSEDSEDSDGYQMPPTPPPTPRSPAEYIWAFTDLFSSAPLNQSIYDSEWLSSLNMKQENGAPLKKSDIELLNAIMADLKMGEKKLPNYINRNSILIQMEKIEFIPQHHRTNEGTACRKRGRKSRSIRPINRFKRVFMRLEKRRFLETIEENLELEEVSVGSELDH
ncbi:hypothetical protein CAEBREN_21774 [Caenorhabditis brenneri]|uniref:Uncharacterized protein n=1 Tax=Caenorhabditis brenneri TaxID=135651 RepID=G0N0B6_CAEBE|nr:hypothetical protein CAEBREN_21774 [Caenorhabditis brenneri]